MYFAGTLKEVCPEKSHGHGMKLGGMSVTVTLMPPS